MQKCRVPERAKTQFSQASKSKRSGRAHCTTPTGQGLIVACWHQQPDTLKLFGQSPGLEAETDQTTVPRPPPAPIHVPLSIPKQPSRGKGNLTSGEERFMEPRQQAPWGWGRGLGETPGVWVYSCRMSGQRQSPDTGLAGPLSQLGPQAAVASVPDSSNPSPNYFPSRCLSFPGYKTGIMTPKRLGVRRPLG